MEKTSRYTITLDDDPIVAKFIARATGINSLPFTSGKTLLKRSSSYSPVAVFIDVHLDVSDCGLDVIPHLRNLWPHVPLIVITGDPTDNLVGIALAIGANDFIRKPLSASELQGRLHARIAEMFSRKSTDTLTIGDVAFSQTRSSIERDGNISYLPNLEARLFAMLVQNANMIVSREEIKRRLWGRIQVSENTLDKKISRIRKALAEIGSDLVIKSQYGQGVLVEYIKTNQSAA